MRRKKWLCPECGSGNIYYSIGASLGATRGANRLYITLGLVSAPAALDIYVCGECGAIRTFISESQSLRKITETWPKLSEERQSE